jgi:1-acyl-sn-glycerol-3-phosphate acyltransferase
MRLLLVVPAIAILTLSLIPVQWLSLKLNLPLARRIPGFYHRILCRLIDVRVHVVGSRVNDQPLMIVSNHVSWLDISVMTAVAPVVFVAKSEVARWPLFGLLARLQRSVFVDRTKRHKTADVNAQIAQRLAGGDPVVLFGEGTSSDGNRVLPFRTALIGAARDAIAEAGHVKRVWLQPLSIAYIGLLGLPLGRQHRRIVAWYGDFTIFPHLAGVLRRGGVDVTVTWGEPVPYDETSDRKDVARSLERRVRRLTSQALRGRVAQDEVHAAAQPADAQEAGALLRPV